MLLTLTGLNLRPVSVTAACFQHLVERLGQLGSMLDLLGNGGSPIGPTEGRHPCNEVLVLFDAEGDGRVNNAVSKAFVVGQTGP